MGAERLSAAVRATRVADDRPLPEGGDFAWAVRRGLVRMIPPGLVKPIAMAKAAAEARFKRR